MLLTKKVYRYTEYENDLKENYVNWHVTRWYLFGFIPIYTDKYIIY